MGQTEKNVLQSVWCCHSSVGDGLHPSDKKRYYPEAGALRDDAHPELSLVIRIFFSQFF